ncbi:MAG: hypothetical protein IPP13_20480 [Kouleothrix sp.]|jgi:hypothetical protein|nr:hypothetical protein [Kouleothrix sp.]
MPNLPIRRMILYKHGVGYFERRGAVAGTELRLSFPRTAMDDVLKSLIALDLGAGQVRGVDFETPEDRAAQIARGSIHLSDQRSLLDLLRDLRGRRVRLQIGEDRPNDKKGFGLGTPRRPAPTDEPGPGEPPAPPTTQAEGLVIGVDVEDEEQLRFPLVSIYQPDQRIVRTFAVREIRRIEVLDDRSAEDLTYFLRAAQSEEDRRAATLRLSDGEHDLLVGYIAPAPAWRVSYRMLAELSTENQASAAQGAAAALGAQFSVLLQGWGLFDNQLDEDLEDVVLTLVAGMPVSFRYRLYEPHTPERPLVADEERTVAAPVEFTGMAAAPAMAPAPAMAMKRGRMQSLGAAPQAMADSAVSIEAAAASTVPASVGEERGALFQYHVAHPVSVARGQSAMVPIVGQRLKGRKELLYNGQKLPRHPVASLRLRNETGLTLERGPVTVLEQGDYAGEAVLPFTRTGGELIVPYAVELGISVAEEHSSERHISGLRVRDDYLVIQEWDVQITRYRIHSTLAVPAEVTLEQALAPNYELTDTPAPIEQAQGIARWVVASPANAEVSFSIRQRSETSRWEQLRSISAKQLREFVQHRYLDEATYRELAGVLDTYGQIDGQRRRIEEIERDRKAIYKQQQQIQGSLGPLGRDGDEGALRTRYVATLGGLEDRLAALAAEEQQLNSTIAQLEETARQRLAALTTAA